MERISNLSPELDSWALRRPGPTDGRAVHGLVSRCPPLDLNSEYCYLLQCTHFADTCVIGEHEGTPRAWLSAYLEPAAPNRLFIWQIAVDPEARGLSLGRRMALALLARPACADVQYVTATVTPSNSASQALFASLAAELGAPLETDLYFDREQHFGGQHESEELITIGPVMRSKLARHGSAATTTREYA